MENNKATHIDLPTFSKDNNGYYKEKGMTSVTTKHIHEGQIRAYEDKGKIVDGRSIINYGNINTYVSLSLSELKAKLSEKLGLKFV